MKFDILVKRLCIYNALQNQFVSDLIFKKGHFLQNNFDQMLTINHSCFCHFLQEVYKIQYLRSLAIALLR